MTRFTTVSMDAVHANRARHIAKHLRIPVSALLATLVDASFEYELGIRPSTVTRIGGDLQIELGDDLLTIPASQAADVVTHLRDIASGQTRDRTRIDLDLPDTLAFGRRGSAVFIESLQEPKFRHTMGVAQANRLADEIASVA
ncbi:hypothetical protein [Bosea sp. (in: a-proteobacteria)]|uniref:hypothetical protein n=1 Tax=Bosea sp. (in: a-proteobacteria) TaxID=1871050 RepID=UPI001ACFCAB7|nr:hypothetical protein [Bosea sp. (in: a-proteobacteria)]MBN9437038.1 hypothetical protein [Bosea sp. (in: a-proteobacteria)]